MTPAKPQQMSGQNDPDDLIAELTKLMASDARSGGDAPKVVPAAPAQSAPRPMAPQTIRIPGMSQPVAAGGSAAPTKFDFGRAPQGTAMPAPEPLANWQDRLGGGKPANAQPPAFATPATGRQEPSLGTANWRPAIAPGEAEREAAGSGPAFEFDFGFNRQRPEPPKPAPAPAQARPAPVQVPIAPPPAAAAPMPAPARVTVPALVSAPAAPAPAAAAPIQAPARPARDPIADLIAAELDAAAREQAMPVAAAAPQPIAVEPQVEAMPAEPEPEPAPGVARRIDFAPFSAPQRPALQPIAMMPAPSAPAQPRPTPPAQRAAPESDRFATAPVFGLGNRPAGVPVTPKVELDPMDEIENLIGEAVRVELNAPPPPVVRQAQPVVPPLNNNFAPRRTSLREPEAAPGGAEEAILAAAAATGAEVGRIDSRFADEQPVKPKKQTRRARPVRDERPSGGAFKQLVVPAIAGTILLALGFGLFWALGMGHNDGKAPVLTADATPAKTVPAKPAATAPHSVVMDELSGTAPPAGKETLVSRDQTAGTDAAQVAAPAATTAAAASDADGGLANRKVRTVTVRPDGSIVSSDDSVAGAAQLPVQRPNVPAVPGVTAANAAEPAADAATPSTSAPAATSTATAAPTTTTVPAAAGFAAQSPTPGTTAANAAPSADAAPASPEMASSDASAQPDATAPVPMSRSLRPQQMATNDTSSTDTAAAQPETAAPASPRPTSAVNALVRPAGGAQKPMDLIGDLAASSEDPVVSSPKPTTSRPAPRPAATQQLATADTAAPAAAASSAPAHVQLSSQQSAAGAQASAASLQRKFGSLFNGVKPQVVKVDLGAKGIYYRVVIPAASLGAAQQLCGSIKSNGGECVAGNG